MIIRIELKHRKHLKHFDNLIRRLENHVKVIDIQRSGTFQIWGNISPSTIDLFAKMIKETYLNARVTLKDDSSKRIILCIYKAGEKIIDKDYFTTSNDDMDEYKKRMSESVSNLFHRITQEGEYEMISLLDDGPIDEDDDDVVVDEEEDFDFGEPWPEY